MAEAMKAMKPRKAMKVQIRKISYQVENAIRVLKDPKQRKKKKCPHCGQRLNPCQLNLAKEILTGKLRYKVTC